MLSLYLDSTRDTFVLSKCREVVGVECTQGRVHVQGGRLCAVVLDATPCLGASVCVFVQLCRPPSSLFTRHSARAPRRARRCVFTHLQLLCGPFPPVLFLSLQHPAHPLRPVCSRPLPHGAVVLCLTGGPAGLWRQPPLVAQLQPLPCCPRVLVFSSRAHHVASACGLRSGRGYSTTCSTTP